MPSHYLALCTASYYTKSPKKLHGGGGNISTKGLHIVD